MAYFAKLNAQNIVEQVVAVGDEMLLDNGAESEAKGIEFLRTLYNEPNAVWVQTSYNSRGGRHTNGGIAFRKNYATIGGLYDIVRDAFIPRKRYGSWHLNEDTCLWDPPTPMPTDGGFYHWDEANKVWVGETQ
jgi:hypothetical protein